MKVIIIVLVLAAGAWFGWGFAKRNGWVGRGAEIQQQLEGQKNREFNKAEPGQ